MNDWIVYSGLALLNIVVYWRTIFYDVLIDDCNRILKARKDYQKYNIVRKIWRNLHYSGNHTLNLKLDHSINIVLHTVVCCMVYVAFGKTPLAIFTALLFAIHPATTQVSCWLNGKRYAIMTMLVLAVWILKPVGIWLYVFIPIWQMGGIPAPFLYLTTQWWYVPFFALPLLWFTRKYWVERIKGRLDFMPAGEYKRFTFRKLVNFVKMFGYYTLHCMFPRRLSFFHTFLESFGFSKEDNDKWYKLDWTFWRGIATMVVVFTSMIYFWGTPIGLGLYWYVIFIVMWLNFPVAICQSFSERACYLSIIGLTYAIVNAIALAPPTIRIILYTALATYYITKLWYYIPAHKDIKTFYKYTFLEFPDHFRAYAHEAQRYLTQQKMFSALHYCTEGLSYRPKDCRLNVLMAQSLMGLGYFAQAREYLKRAESNMQAGEENRLHALMEKLREGMAKLEKKKDTVNHTIMEFDKYRTYTDPAKDEISKEVNPELELFAEEVRTFIASKQEKLQFLRCKYQVDIHYDVKFSNSKEGMYTVNLSLLEQEKNNEKV